MISWEWGVAALLVIGIVIISYGWLSDAMRAKRERDGLKAAPPDKLPELPAPAYVTQFPTDKEALSESEREHLTTELEHSVEIAGRLATADFVTDSVSKAMITWNPLVLIVDSDLTSMREILPAIKYAKTQNRPLIVGATGFDARLLGELAANVALQIFQIAPIIMDSQVCRQACEITRAELAEISDLRSGYLPPTLFGSARLWVSDEAKSTIQADENLN
ncbi:MAG: hypothetical protein FWG47_06675 [Propionibacteriaceae bacterium]|nr:hypothetical protein [Propionibacteriaceae bacterium]